MTYEEFMIQKYGVKKLDREEKERIVTLLDSMWGPTPWGARNYPPIDIGDDVLRWSENEELNCISLTKDCDTHPILALGMYLRPFPINEHTLAFWTETDSELVVTAVNLRKLEPLPLRSHVAHFEIRCADGAVVSMKFPIGVLEGEHDPPVTPEFASCTEILMVGHSGMNTRENWDAPAAAVYAWKPSQGSLKVTMLDWFTGRAFDLGYEWITDIVRDPITGHIFGRGFRIPQFELAEDDKSLLRWFYAYAS